MLVLTRFEGERLFCELPDGREIVFKVIEVRSCGKVRIGIEAPDDVNILREELLEEVGVNPAAERDRGDAA